MNQVIEIGDFRLKREKKWRLEGCAHRQLVLDDDGEFVTCEDCGKQVGNYAALRMLVERWALLQERADRQQQAISEASKKTLGLRAAQRVERAWRSRSMVPTCPHCHEAIFPEDGFGGSAVSREIADRRRAVVRAAQQAPTGGAAQACPCFPGACRGGEVVNGRLANGQLCAAASASGA